MVDCLKLYYKNKNKKRLPQLPKSNEVGILKILVHPMSPFAAFLNPTMTDNLNLPLFETEVPEAAPQMHNPAQLEESESELSSSNLDVARLGREPPDMRGKEFSTF